MHPWRISKVTCIGDVPFSTHIALWPYERPLACGTPFGLTSCGEQIPARGLFVLFPRLKMASESLWGEEFFAFMRLLRNFQWYDFASNFVYGKV